MNTSALFELLNISIILLYTNYVTGALLLDLFITSDEFEIIIEKTINFLKEILSKYIFFGCDQNVRL